MWWGSVIDPFSVKLLKGWEVLYNSQMREGSVHVIEMPSYRTKICIRLDRNRYHNDRMCAVFAKLVFSPPPPQGGRV